MAIVSRSTGKKLALFAAFIIAFLTIYFQFGELLSLKSLAAREAELRSYQQRQPVLVFGVAFLVYVAVTGLSIPGASAMTIVCGWFLGFWRALLLVSFASTAGATVAFLVSRYLLRDTIQDRFGERLSTFHDRLEREGAFYLFLLRLVPAVPFFVINAVMGLTPLPARTFWWVSQLGMLPGTVVYVYAGASVPSLDQLAEQGIRGILTPQLAIAFALLGLTPLLIRKLVTWFRPQTSLPGNASDSVRSDGEPASDEKKT